MAATDIQTLFSESRCFACYGDVSTATALKLALLRRKLIAISPMAATDPQTLFAAASCYQCFGPLTTAQLLELAMLQAQLNALNPAIPTDAQSLVTYGTCFACPGASMFEIMELALLDQISQNGGGSPPVICANLEGPDADPNGIVTPDFVGQTYLNGGNVWQAGSLLNNSWVEICAGSDVTNLVVNDTALLAFTLQGGDITATLSFPNLTSVAGLGVIISDNGPLGTVSFPALATATDLTFAGNSSLTSLNLSALALVNSLVITSNPLAVAPFNLGALTQVGVLLSITSSNITALNLSALANPLPGVTITDNASLTVFSMNGQPLVDGGTYDFGSNALNQASVDLVLAAGVAGAMMTGLIQLAFGTNAAPSVAGQADKAALILAGVNVTTN